MIIDSHFQHRDNPWELIWKEIQVKLFDSTILQNAQAFHDTQSLKWLENIFRFVFYLKFWTNLKRYSEEQKNGCWQNCFKFQCKMLPG